MEKKIKVMKVSAFVVALGLIIGVGIFANALVGNPISKMLATNTAEKHIETTYPDTDFFIERVSYSFKDGNYYAHVKSPGSIDSKFSLCVSMSGELKWDGYEDSVLSGQNTANRLNMEYRALVDKVLESPVFPFESDIGFGDLVFVQGEYAHSEEIPDFALITEALELDQLYDICELGEQAGLLVLYVQDDEVSVERAAEILIKVKQLMDAGGVPFYAIDFVLEYPRPEEGETRREGRVETMEFLYEDIYEEGMIERVDVANQAAVAYYAEMDEKDTK